MKLSDGRYRRCHQDQLRKCTVAVNAPPDQSDAEIVEELPIPPAEPDTSPMGSTSEVETPSPTVNPDNVSDDVAPSATSPVKINPKRNRVPRSYLVQT